MSVEALVFQAVGHLMEEHDAQASWRPLVGRHGEVCGRVARRIEGLSVVIDVQHQLVVVHCCLKLDGCGLSVIDDICHSLLYGQTQAFGFPVFHPCLIGHLGNEGLYIRDVIH